MYVGNKEMIDLSSSHFPRFIKNGFLYVDKTVFIEHVLANPSSALLFTRPHRFGKSLNLSMLATFLDCRQNSRDLFRGLYIEGSSYMKYLNKYPVINIDFSRVLLSSYEKYQSSVRDRLINIIESQVPESWRNNGIKQYLLGGGDNEYILVHLMETMANIHQKPCILLIDGYDKILMETFDKPRFNDFRQSLIEMLTTALNNNPNLEKAVLTGTVRISHEDMFNSLNTLDVYDILRPSEYDTDFYLTEEEVHELVPEGKWDIARTWYDGVRVDESSVYNIFATMCYLKSFLYNGYPSDFWASSGGAGVLKSLLSHDKKCLIGRMLESGEAIQVRLDNKLNLSLFQTRPQDDDILFFTLAVQAGYLAYKLIDDQKQLYYVYIPNRDVRNAWERLIGYVPRF